MAKAPNKKANNNDKSLTKWLKFKPKLKWRKIEKAKNINRYYNSL